MLETLNKTDFNSKIYHRQILIKDLSNIIKAKSTITFLNKLSFSSLSTDLSYDGLKNYIKFEEINVPRKSFSEPNEEKQINFFDFKENDIVKELNDEEKLKLQGELILTILTQRKKKAIQISSFLKRKYNRIYFKKKFLINLILQKRFFLISKIQSNIKGYLTKKSITKIFNCEYIFFYRLSPDLSTTISKSKISKENNKNNKNKNDVRCKIKAFNNREFKFIYCRPLNCFYLPLSKIRVLRREYKINFIVNGKQIIDSRYQVDTDNKGNFYNIITKPMIFRYKKTDKEIEIQNNFNNYNSNNKYWESIFEMKKIKKANSYDSLSISNSNISNETNVAPVYESEISNKSNIISILKNPLKKVDSIGDNNKKEKKNRNVSFSNKIMYCY
jgi:hypothetical protein